MKKLVIIMVSLVMFSKGFSQDVLVDREGTAHFFSEAPLEDIEAINEKAIGALDLNKGTVAVSMLIKNFHFDKSLMEEHFNENYLESEKYPKASFKGTIRDFSKMDLSKPGTYQGVAEGSLNIHGVTQPLSSSVEFKVAEDSIVATTTFQVKLEDHKIKIPKLVIKNIAEVVDVDATFNFVKK